jgi:hypothetical protein
MFDQPSVDDREFGTERSICEYCGADLVDDAHARWCRDSVNYFEPDKPDEDFAPDFGLGE